MSEVLPFTIDVPQSDLDDLTARLRATRWVEDVVGGDAGYGTPLPFVQKLCRHWTDAFDWRAFEARINREPNVMTEIDGLRIHALHRRSPRDDATPLILIHGWPSSVLEFLDVCEPLADPPAGEAAFHVVAPSLPGYGYSTTRPGMTPQRVAALLAALMERLGYDRFMIQGGNWGSLIGAEMARQFPERIIGLHLNTLNGSPPPDRDSLPLTPEEEGWVDDQSRALTFPHFGLLSQVPFTPAHALNDFPAGLAGWIGEKLWDWSDNRQGPALTLDWMVGTIAFYWFTGTIGSSSLLYYEMVHDMWKERYVSTPTAATIFGGEWIRLPRSWAERHYNIVQWTLTDRGGHFPATEVPGAYIEALRTFARALEIG